MGDHAITWLNMPLTFDELFNEHHTKVFLAAYRVTGSRQDAEDILQTVFLRLLNNAEKADFSAPSAAYLCKSAINAGLDVLRSKRRIQTDTFNEEYHATEFGNAESTVKQAELKQQLRTALLSLDDRAAEVFALRVFEEFNNGEIAAVLETTSNSVAVTLHQARAHLQEILGELEGEDQ
jgi:RNA polymerase sigma-70 factor (ECF subfamily)